MKILALDLGNHTGYAFGDTGTRVPSKFGTRNFTPAGHHVLGMAYWRLRGWLTQVYRAEPFDRLIYERVTFINRHNSTEAVHRWGGWEATVTAWACEHGIQHASLTVREIKSGFCGNPSAPKEQIIARCRQMGWSPDTDNCADAMAIFWIASNGLQV